MTDEVKRSKRFQLPIDTPSEKPEIPEPSPDIGKASGAVFKSIIAEILNATENKRVKKREDVPVFTTIPLRIPISSAAQKKRDKWDYVESQINRIKERRNNEWVSSDGRCVLISEMDDKWLSNAITFCLKKVNKNLVRLICAGYDELSAAKPILSPEEFDFQKEGFEKSLKELDYLRRTQPKLINLINEAVKRGVRWREPRDDEYITQ